MNPDASAASTFLFEEIFAKRAGTIKAGLDRVRLGDQALGGIAVGTPSILVAGTNGKGSTSGMIWHLLANQGIKAAFYSSPHLIDFRERYRVAGECITDEMLIALLHDMKSRLSTSKSPKIYDELSFFEVATLLAFVVFKESRSQLNVMEVGLGGRLDATNICDPSISVITSIGKDHVEYLGDSLQEIAREKSGVIRKGKPLVYGGRDAASLSVLDVIADEAQKNDAPLYVAGQHFGLLMSGSQATVFGNVPNQFNYEVALPTWLLQRGQYLRENYAIAAFVVALHLNQVKSDLQLSNPINDLISNPKALFSNGSPFPPTLVGRFDIREVDICAKGPNSPNAYMKLRRRIIFDVCHNIEGVETFLRSLNNLIAEKQLPLRLPILMTVLRDKDFSGMIERLEKFAEAIILFQNSSDRSIQREDFTTLQQKKSWQCELFFSESRDEAVKMAGSLPHFTRSHDWMLCGSVHGIGQALRYFDLSVPESF